MWSRASPVFIAAPKVARPKERRAQGALGRESAFLEVVRQQLVARQQFVEVRAVALRQARRLAHIAGRDLQDLRQIVAGEFITRLVERGQAGGVAAERLPGQFRRDYGSVR